MLTLMYGLFALLVVSAYWTGQRSAFALAHAEQVKLRSRPHYHGFFVLICCALPALVVLAIWLIAEQVVIPKLVLARFPSESSPEQFSIWLTEIQNIAQGSFGMRPSSPDVADAAERYRDLHQMSRIGLMIAFLGIGAMGLWYSRSKVRADLPARQVVERVLEILLLICSGIAIFTTIGIVCSLIFETIRFFKVVSPLEFLFGTHWSPQIALRADQAGSSGAFGAVPLFMGTALIAFIAMCVAVPVGLLAAVYLSEYAGKHTRTWAKPLLEILAGIPTVVYGFFAALTVAPFLREFGGSFGLSVSSESALAAGLVMGVMIIPFVSSLSDDVINSVPQTLRDGSYALGATKSETIKKVIIPAALPGIVGSVLLAISRAVGETMIVVMAAGLAANLTLNPLENVTTVTVQIVTTLVGDQEFDSAKTLSAFALGLLLFFVTLVLNVIALEIVKRYREKYD